MGLFERIFGRRLRDLAAGTIFRTLTAYSPVFITRGGALYESELVRSAIDARARHIGKLRVELLGSAQPTLKAKLERSPNPWQTWYQFLYRTSTILDMQNTVFIVPVLDDFDRTNGFFPVLPSRCEVVDYGGEVWLRFRFSGGETAAVELHRCAVLTKFQYESDLYGADNGALSPTIDLIDIRNQGIGEAVKNASSYRFMARVNNFSKTEDLKKERERFSEENFGKEAKGGGILLFPNTYPRSSSCRTVLIPLTRRRWSRSGRTSSIISASTMRSFRTKPSATAGTRSTRGPWRPLPSHSARR